MIRFIDMREAQIAGIRFAFWNTVTDQFIGARSSDMAWDNWDEFAESYDGGRPLERFRALVPGWAFTPSPDKDE